MKPVPAIAAQVVDTKKLAELERAIDRAEASYIEVGQALDKMRKLFPDSNRFELHAQRLWGWSRSTIYERIQAAEIAVQLRSFGPLPASKEVAIALAGLNDQDRRKLWKELNEQARGRITAAAVLKAIEDRLGKPAGAGPGEVAPELAAAFESLPAEAKLDTIHRAEEDAREHEVSRHEHADSSPAERIEQGLRLLRRAETLFLGLGDEAEFVIGKIRQAIEVAHRLES